jgi:hypothetical protein
MRDVQIGDVYRRFTGQIIKVKNIIVLDGHRRMIYDSISDDGKEIRENVSRYIKDFLTYNEFYTLTETSSNDEEEVL